VPGFAVPFSTLASEAARQSYIEQHSPAFYASPIAQMQKLPIAQQRATLDKYYLEPLIAKARKAYPVTIKPWTVGGVYTDVVEPADGLTEATKGRVLINLHGGGFVMGARTNGQLEAIPVAGLGKYKVVTVDYRQGPENRFPAGSEDVAIVYRELLKTYKPADIGIYGCSAGGLLAAQAVAWFQKENLPRPGALGIFCASAGNLGAGDSGYTAAVLNGQMPPPPHKQGDVAPSPYFAGVNMNDPMVSPVNYPDVIVSFPPTLVITSTRDFAMSSAIDTHRQLVKAKVDAELHVWDGMQHFFFADVDLPESREAYQVMVDFFARHLK
jgi:acetyl esterase/lipase